MTAELVLVRWISDQDISDLFKAGTTLSNLGVLAILGTLVVALGVFAVWAYRREVKRADAAEALAVTLSSQFDRALDILERQSNRRRSGDAR